MSWMLFGESVMERKTVRTPVLCDWTYYAGSLSGRVYGHAAYRDGEKIATSLVTSIDVHTGFALTQSGSQYALEWPDMDYLRLALLGLRHGPIWPPRGVVVSQ